MSCRHKTCLSGYRRNAFAGFLDQILGCLDAHSVDIFNQTQIGGFLEQAAEIIGADIKLAGNAGQGEFSA